MRRTVWCAGLAVLLSLVVSPTPRGAAPTAPDSVAIAAPVGPLSEAAAMSVAVASGRPIEVSQLTTERVRVVADPRSRTFRADVSPLPVRVPDGRGGWRAVDTTLVRRGDGMLAPRAAASDMAFSGGGDRILARIADRADWMAWSWPTALPEPVLSGSTATYANVLPDVDLVVEAGVEGFAEFVVVKSARAAANPALARLTFDLSSSGLRIEEDSGGLVARDATGAPVFRGPAPRMWDSSGGASPAVTSEPQRSRSAVMELSVSGSRLIVAPDLRLLHDPTVAFPLVLDPASSKSKQRTYWTMVWSDGQKFPNHPTEHARVGYDGWSDGKISRVFYRFDSAFFAGKHILSATLRHAQIHSPEHDCNDGSFGPGVKLYRTGAISSSTSWSNQPFWASYISTSTATHGNENYCPGFTTVEWNAEAAVATAAANKFADLTLGLRSADESDRNGWRKYDNTSTYPVLQVYYNSKPNVPQGSMADPQVTCSTSSTSPVVINDTTPKLKAVMTDPEGSSAELQAHYEIYEGGTKVWEKVESSWVASGQPQDETVSPALLNGHTYKWRVRAEEYIQESWDYGPWYPSSQSTNLYCHFRIDTTTPGQPQVVGDVYPKFNGDDTTAFGGVGQVGRFTLTADPATAGSVSSYRYQLNNGSWVSKPTTAGAPLDIFLAPDHLGINMLHVVSVTGAGTPSVPNDYDFNVDRGSAPTGVWELNESTGTTAPDSSGAGRTANLGGGAVWSPTMGRLGGSIDLDGTTGNVATATGVVDTTASFTVSAWVRSDTLASSERTVLAQSGSATSGFRLGWSSSAGGWVFSRANSNVASPTVTKATSSIKGAAKVWTHLAGVYDAQAKQIRLYVNGVLDTTDADGSGPGADLIGQRAFTTPWATTGPLDVGRVKLGATYTEYFDGRVDEIRVWSRVVAPEELALIAVHLEDPANGEPRPVLAGHWALNETGTVTTAVDSTPYARDGALVGGTGATWIPDPDYTSVLHLNGNTGVYVQANGRSIDPNGSFTVIARVRPAGPLDVGIIVAQAGVHESAWELRLDTDDFFRFARTADDVANTAPVLASSTAAWPVSAEDPNRYELDTWVHLTAVYDAPAGLMYLYIDGLLQNFGGTPFASKGWTPGGGLAIGLAEDNDAAVNGMEGDYEDVRVYTGVMSAGAIYNDYLGS